MSKRAADLIVEALEAYEVERVWCVPGESYLTLLDSLHDSSAVQTMVCRHESGAGFMAVADAKLSGKPAVFMPRTYPRQEQSIRARRLEQLGLGRSVEDMDPMGILAGIEEGLAGGSTADRAPRLDGAQRLSQVAGDLLGATAVKSENPAPTLAS